MIYRDFGKTGVKISALGFGGMRFQKYEKDGKNYIDEDIALPLIEKAFESGINYFDTAPYYCDDNSEYITGKGVKKFRDKVNISTKCSIGEHIKSPGDYRQWLENSLKKLDTDHVDFYHMWGIDRNAFDNYILKLDLIKEAMKLKEEGLIRHISFSTHDTPENVMYMIDHAPFESMLIQYNILDRSNAESIEYAKSKGLGVIVMGPVGGGRLAFPTSLYNKLTGKPSIATYELALRFVLSNKNVDCALSGMSSMDMLTSNLALAGNESALSEDDSETLNAALDKLRKFSDLYCTGCRYCMPCPGGLDIPKIFEAYTTYNVYELHEHARNMYKEMINKEEKTAKDCLECGRCETKCPQKISIMTELKRVEEILSNAKA